MWHHEFFFPSLREPLVRCCYMKQWLTESIKEWVYHTCPYLRNLGSWDWKCDCQCGNSECIRLNPSWHPRFCRHWEWAKEWIGDSIDMFPSDSFLDTTRIFPLELSFRSHLSYGCLTMPTFWRSNRQARANMLRPTLWWITFFPILTDRYNNFYWNC